MYRHTECLFYLHIAGYKIYFIIHIMLEYNFYRYDTERNVILLFFTCKLSHPLSKPSSIPFIWLPLRSRICSCVNPWNSLLENIGFKLSPNKLSASLSSCRVFCNPASSLSVSRLRELPEKSIDLNGNAGMWKLNT